MSSLLVLRGVCAAVVARPADYRRMSEAIGLVESAWFFRRGAQTVRIVRVGGRGSRAWLKVDGPGSSSVVHEFDDQLSCVLQQCEIERQLASRHFYLEQAGHGRR